MKVKILLVAVALLLAGCDRPPFADPVIPPAKTCPKLPPGFACATGQSLRGMR